MSESEDAEEEEEYMIYKYHHRDDDDGVNLRYRNYWKCENVIVWPINSMTDEDDDEGDNGVNDEEDG